MAGQRRQSAQMFRQSVSPVLDAGRFRIGVSRSPIVFAEKRSSPKLLMRGVQGDPRFHMTRELVRSRNNRFQSRTHVVVTNPLVSVQRARVAAEERQVLLKGITQTHDLLALRQCSAATRPCRYSLWRPWGGRQGLRLERNSVCSERLASIGESSGTIGVLI